MSNAAQLLTEDQYLAMELASDQRHELADGVVRAMTGASRRHNEIAGNLYIALRAANRGGDCRVAVEGVRLRVTAKRHYYPDVMVSCAAPDDNEYTESQPCLIAEILSPTTTTIDRGEKRIAYFAIPTMRHYLIIDNDGAFIEHHTRTDETNNWTITIARPGDTINITCPPTTLTVDDILATN
jgi:Uma2 family endonuclease